MSVYTRLGYSGPEIEVCRPGYLWQRWHKRGHGYIFQLWDLYDCEDRALVWTDPKGGWWYCYYHRFGELAVVSHTHDLVAAREGAERWARAVWDRPYLSADELLHLVE
jgi:hypothetical protein